MNSNSRYIDDCDACGASNCNRYKKEISSCPTIVKCSCPGAVTIPVATVVSTTFTPASLTVDTSGIKDPCTRIDFTSNIVATAFTGSLSFQVFKQCANQFSPIPVGPAFSYSRLVAVTDSDTFSFFICDCDGCFNECCTYTVVVTVNTVTVGVLTINNATLGAITTCQSSRCC